MLLLFVEPLLNEFLFCFFAASVALHGVEGGGGEGLDPEEESGEPGDDDDGVFAADGADDTGSDVRGRGADPSRRGGDLAVVARRVSVGEHTRADGAGADDGDAEAVTAELAAEGFAETDESELAGAVGGESGSGDEAADAGEIDDVRSGLIDEEREKATGESDGGVEVDCEDAIPLGFGGFEGGSVPGDAGIVDEDVEFAPGGLNACGEGLDLLRIGEIADVGFDFEVLRAKFVGELVERLVLTIDEEEFETEGDQRADDFPADACCGAGDEDLHAGFDAHGIPTVWGRWRNLKSTGRITGLRGGSRGDWDCGGGRDSVHLYIFGFWVIYWGISCRTNCQIPKAGVGDRVVEARP